MTTHPMHESHTFSGEWWVPSASDAPPEQTIQPKAGVLQWGERGGATLELHSSLTPLRGTIYADDEQLYPAVHGATTHSQLVSLLDGMRFGSPMAFGPAGVRERELIRSSWMVVGAHVTSQSLFAQIEARIPGLSMWLGSTGAQQALRPKTEGSPPAMTYEFPGVPEEVFEIVSLPGVLGFRVGRTFSGNLDSTVSVTTSGYLRIRPAEPQTLHWLVDRLGRATTLLALIAGSPMGPDHLQLKLSMPAEQDCELLVELREAKRCIHKNAREFFMTRPRMQAEIGTIFSNWFALYERIAMPCQLALSVLYSEGLWLHVEFLSLIQALEGFHRAVMDGTYLSKDDYEPVRKSLCQAIPAAVKSDHRDALKSKIKYGYEFSLRKRLEAVVGRLGMDIRERILGPGGSVPRTWVDTRNYYTHWDETERASVLDGAGMHRAGVRMKHLLRALYLDLVGVPQPAILTALDSPLYNESQYLIQLNAMQHRKENPGSTAGALMRIDVLGRGDGGANRPARMAQADAKSSGSIVEGPGSDQVGSEEKP